MAYESANSTWTGDVENVGLRARTWEIGEMSLSYHAAKV